MAHALKCLFLLLILGNLIFFAWAAGHFGSLDDGREPVRSSNQKAAETLQVIMPDHEPITEKKTAAISPIEPTISSDAESSTPVTEACRMISGLKPSEAQSLQAQSELIGLTALIRKSPASNYWVFIPPLPNKAAATKKMMELKQLGVQDMFLMADDGPDQMAISLGMFSSEQAAADYLHRVIKQGVKSARMQARNKSSAPTQIEIRGPHPVLLKKLSGLLAGATRSGSKININECMESH